MFFRRESADLGYRTDSRSPSRFNSGSGGGTGSSSGGGQTMSNSSGASNSLYHHSSTSPNFSTYRDSGSSGSRDRDRDRDQGTSGSGVGAGIGTSQLMVPQGQSGNDGNLTNPDRNFSNESCDSCKLSGCFKSVLRNFYCLFLLRFNPFAGFRFLFQPSKFIWGLGIFIHYYTRPTVLLSQFWPINIFLQKEAKVSSLESH